MTVFRKHRIACFISPHGYGHAARAAAVMEAIYGLSPDTEFEIFTAVPEWFFHASLSGTYSYHFLITDIGLVQETSMKADLRETMARLNSFLPFQAQKISDLARLVLERRCRLVLCDIAPMGILVAGRARIPSVLIENFTWDWIYEKYLPEHTGLDFPISYLGEIFERADFHVQAQPVCRPTNAHLTIPPVSRRPRASREETRTKLGIGEPTPVAMITMGGIQETYPFRKQLAKMDDTVFILPGAGRKPEKRENLLFLPRQSRFFHPDLVTASDAVIGKVGYSTLSEVYWAGIPFGYIGREDFRESPFLVSFIENAMKGIAFSEHEFYGGAFASRLPELFALGRTERKGSNGAEKAARFITDINPP